MPRFKVGQGLEILLFLIKLSLLNKHGSRSSHQTLFYLNSSNLYISEHPPSWMPWLLIMLLMFGRVFYGEEIYCRKDWGGVLEIANLVISSLTIGFPGLPVSKSCHHSPHLTPLEMCLISWLILGDHQDGTLSYCLIIFFKLILTR